MKKGGPISVRGSGRLGPNRDGRTGYYFRAFLKSAFVWERGRSRRALRQHPVAGIGKDLIMGFGGWEARQGLAWKRGET